MKARTHMHHALWVLYRCRHCTISREIFSLKQHQFSEVVKHGDEEIPTKKFYSSSWWKYHGAFNCLKLVQVEAIPRHRDSISLTK